MSGGIETKILVAYATKYGATKEIAEKLGELFNQAGVNADVLQVKKIKDIEQYKAVVVGSAVYIGQWRKEAVSFVKNNENSLKKRPVWFFSSGPTGNGNPVELTQGWQFPKSLQPFAESIEPKDIKLFHGAIDMNKLGFIFKFMTNKVGAAVGDFRDWNAIHSWGNLIVKELTR